MGRQLQKADFPAPILNAQYAVRGKVVIRAAEIEKEMR